MVATLGERCIMFREVESLGCASETNVTLCTPQENNCTQIFLNKEIYS